MDDNRDGVETVNVCPTDEGFAVPRTEQALEVAPCEQSAATVPDRMLPKEDGRVSRCLGEVFQDGRLATGGATPRSRSSRRPAKVSLLALALSWTTGAACGFSPASPTGASPTGGHEVQIDDGRAAEYWAQFERRLPLWFEKISVPVPGVPHRDEVMAEARFVEIDMGDAETCWYDPPDRLEIRIDMWESGCVPHEIGHLALRMAGHPCWADWEHETEVKKCQDRFK